MLAPLVQLFRFKRSCLAHVTVTLFSVSFHATSRAPCRVNIAVTAPYAASSGNKRIIRQGWHDYRHYPEIIKAKIVRKITNLKKERRANTHNYDHAIIMLKRQIGGRV